ncbi:type II secretion system F family protein [Ruminococcaceae bacterium OttesenSCG-928-I18]|nr:type II secretion system F family protein [Ruminococcaceae bacterium OttesenSCG-928-I18]
MAETKRKVLPPQELAAFFESFTMLLRAGVPANECPDIIAGDTEGSRLSEASARVAGILSGGEVFILSEALDQSGHFPEYAIEMMRLGEESGRMETTSEALGEYYRQQESLGASIRSAISGPLLLLVMMSVVLIFLIIFVLPVFENVFASLGLAAGGGLGGAFLAARVSMVVVGILLAVILVLVVMYLTQGGREKLAGFAQSVPFTRNIHYSMSAARLTGGLAMLLASGIPSGEALQKAGGLISNRRILERLPAAVEKVESGEDLGKVLVSENVLEGFEAKILLSASRAGQTEQAMRNLSDIYSRETESGIDRLLGMLEPALVGLLSVAIGIILLSVMLPLTSIMSALN